MNGPATKLDNWQEETVCEKTSVNNVKKKVINKREIHLVFTQFFSTPREKTDFLVC